MPIYIVGPTSSGKTALAVHIASIFNCEIISADSRQVYKYMDIGTGKDLKEYGKIKYHCINLINPKTEFNLSKYIKKAKKAIKEIEKKGKIPLIVGGTGLYINALSQNYNIQEEKIDEDQRKYLSSLSKEELQNIIVRANGNSLQHPLNKSDWNNPHRLIRWIEKNNSNSSIYSNKKYGTGMPVPNENSLIISISVDKETLHQRIYKRIIDRIEKEGMIEEIYNLHYKHKVSWKKLESFGLEYKFISQYIRATVRANGRLPQQVTQLNNHSLQQTNSPQLYQTINLLATATNQYAKRQITWFKKTPGIIWVDGNNKEKLYKETEKLIKNFLNK